MNKSLQPLSRLVNPPVVAVNLHSIWGRQIEVKHIVLLMPQNYWTRPTDHPLNLYFFEHSCSFSPPHHSSHRSGHDDDEVTIDASCESTGSPMAWRLHACLPPLNRLRLDDLAVVTGQEAHLPLMLGSTSTAVVSAGEDQEIKTMTFWLTPQCWDVGQRRWGGVWGRKVAAIVRLFFG